MKKALYLALLGAAMMGSETTQGRSFTPDEPLTDKEKQDIIDRQMAAKGLKRFVFGDKIIWALNEKSALKKFNKIEKK